MGNTVPIFPHFSTKIFLINIKARLTFWLHSCFMTAASWGCFRESYCVLWITLLRNMFQVLLQKKKSYRDNSVNVGTGPIHGYNEQSLLYPNVHVFPLVCEHLGWRLCEKKKTLQQTVKLSITSCSELTHPLGLFHGKCSYPRKGDGMWQRSGRNKISLDRRGRKVKWHVKIVKARTVWPKLTTLRGHRCLDAYSHTDCSNVCIWGWSLWEFFHKRSCHIIFSWSLFCTAVSLICLHHLISLSWGKI